MSPFSPRGTTARLVASVPGDGLIDEVEGIGPPHGKRVTKPSATELVDTTSSTAAAPTGMVPAAVGSNDRTSPAASGPFHPPVPSRESATRVPVMAIARVPSVPENQPVTSTTRFTVAEL